MKKRTCLQLLIALFTLLAPASAAYAHGSAPVVRQAFVITPPDHLRFFSTIGIYDVTASGVDWVCEETFTRTDEFSVVWRPSPEETIVGDGAGLRRGRMGEGWEEVPLEGLETSAAVVAMAETDVDIYIAADPETKPAGIWALAPGEEVARHIWSAPQDQLIASLHAPGNRLLIWLVGSDDHRSSLATLSAGGVLAFSRPIWPAHSSQPLRYGSLLHVGAAGEFLIGQGLGEEHTWRVIISEDGGRSWTALLNTRMKAAAATRTRDGALWIAGVELGIWRWSPAEGWSNPAAIHPTCLVPRGRGVIACADPAIDGLIAAHVTPALTLPIAYPGDVRHITPSPKCEEAYRVLIQTYPPPPPRP